MSGNDGFDNAIGFFAALVLIGLLAIFFPLLIPLAVIGLLVLSGGNNSS